MKFSCNRNELLNALNNVSKATNTSSTIEILKGIYIEADDKLYIRANNMEISIECVLDAEIEERGETVIDARMLSDIIRKSEEGIINFDINAKNEAFIYTNKNKFNISGLDASTFPKTNYISAEKELKLKIKDFKDIVQDTVFSTAQDESRPILTALKFEISKNEMKVVSVDGYRLSIRKQIIKEREDEFEFLIKGRIANEVVKTLTDDEKDLIISFNGNTVVFEFENYKVTTSLMGGEYINYDQFISRKSKFCVNVDRRLLTQTIERASILINLDDLRTPVIFDIDGPVLSVKCFTKIGEFNEEIEIGNSNEMLKIGLGSKYILEALKAVEDDNVFLNFTDEKSPCILTPIEGDKFYYMVLPKTLN
ncbi:MAG: DNA polymerase III subunit beta [Ruminococcaceae bacterium]|nr:DNA polymerase III subunit beta [Oscillospiraceae bacterium]